MLIRDYQRKRLCNAKHGAIFIIRFYFKTVLNDANTVFGLTYDILRFYLRQSKRTTMKIPVLHHEIGSESFFI